MIAPGFKHHLANKKTLISSILTNPTQSAKSILQSYGRDLLKPSNNTEQSQLAIQKKESDTSIFAPNPSMQLHPHPEMDLSIKEMMSRSMHLGHTPSKWHPAMAPYICGIRAGIHIINLEKTIAMLRRACQAVRSIASYGSDPLDSLFHSATKSPKDTNPQTTTSGCILFVGTSDPIQRLTYECAMNCNQFYINSRWIGGTLTNSTQVLRNNKLLPDLLILLDTHHNSKAVEEAKIMNIPIVAICDTNQDPTHITYPIPANDDAYGSIELVARCLSQAAATVKI